MKSFTDIAVLSMLCASAVGAWEALPDEAPAPLKTRTES